MTEVQLRPARTSDALQIGAVGFAAWCKGIGVHVSSEAHTRIDPDVFSAFARNKSEQIIVAECSGAVIGFAATEDGDNYISDLWVAPDFEGRGAGTALLSAVEDVIAGRGYSTAEVEVLAENARALTLYRRLGYKPVWEGKRQDEVLLVDLNKILLSKLIDEPS